MSSLEEAQSQWYRPLQHDDSFRLLKIRRSPSGEIWKGTIAQERLSLGDCLPKYVALSYVWGDKKFSFEFRGEDHIELKFSASMALGHILAGASKEGELNIWIDQLCINQSDNQEIKQQVSIMWRIYGAAEKVIGWLGPASGESDRTLDDIVLFAAPRNNDPEEEERGLQILRSQFGELQPDDPMKAWSSYVGQCILLDTSLRRRMVQLFNLPWFGRRWIAQEACLASNLRIHRGHRSVSGYQLFQAIRLIQSIVVPAVSTWLQKPYRNAFALLRTRDLVREAVKGQSRLSFVHVLDALSPLECDKDEDRLNALYSIFRQDNSWFSPEYGSASKLYVDFAVGHMRNHGSFTVLHFAGLTEPSRHIFENRGGTVVCKIVGPERDLPSWVPDWRIRHRQLSMLPEMSDGADLGVRSTPFEVPYDPVHKSLTLRGKLLKESIKPFGMPHFDRYELEKESQHQCSMDAWCINMFASFITELDPPLAQLYHVSPTFAHWLQSAECDSMNHRRLNSLVSCFARTLVMDCKVASPERGSHAPPPRDKILEYFLEYATLSLAADTDAMSSAFEVMIDDPESMSKSVAYGYLAEHICRYRRLFVSDGGIVGLGSIGIRPGDRVCFFQGLAIPFVVHPEGDHFELRGECYLDGFMDIPFDDLEGVDREVVLK